MTYNPLKPDAGPSPAIDVSQIRDNFDQFDTIFSANHTALNDRNQGAHEQVILEKQAADPGVTEDLAVLYCKDITSRAGVQPQIFVQIPKFLPTGQDTNDVENTGMQLTYNEVNTAGPVYQSFLPGRLLFYFGVVTGNTTPNVLIADTVSLSPPPSLLLTAIAEPNTVTSGGTPFKVSTTPNLITSSSFVINSTGNLSGASIPYSFTWSAIGLA